VRPHYLICNADESEPGTFKDRALMEGDPFGLVEAMTIAAYATGCEEGFIYLRGEYPLAYERLMNAIDTARARGFLGEDILGHGFHFDIEIRKGGGAYICGEETRSSTRSKDFAASRGTSLRSPCSPACSANHGHQQRRNAGQRARDPANRRPRLCQDRHRRFGLARGSSASPAM
jgi:NADH-quinone oxidoreductase subunit F